jgi:hypothetical protein
VLRAFLIAGITLGILLQPVTASAQPARPATEQMDWRPIAIGLGAVAGVVAFNVLVLGVDALPGSLGYGAGATVPAEMSVAMSRVYAMASAVAGGLIAWYGFGR